MRIPVVLARLMMFVVFAKRCQMLQPPVNILDQSALVVVNVDSGRDVHGRHQHHALLDPTLAHDLFYLGSEVHIGAMRLGVKLKIFGQYFHSVTSGFLWCSGILSLRGM